LPSPRLPTPSQVEPFTGLSDALDGDQPPHAAPFPEFPVIVGLLWSLCPPHYLVANPGQNDGSPIRSDGTLSSLQVPGVPLRNLRVYRSSPAGLFPLTSYRS